MSRLTNYPRRPKVPERWRQYTPDAVVAGLGIVITLLSAKSAFSKQLAYPDNEERSFALLFQAGMVIALLTLHVGVLFRRKAAMALLLALCGLYFLGIYGEYGEALATGRLRFSALSGAGLAVLAGQVIYLPLRLFGVFGPRPEPLIRRRR